MIDIANINGTNNMNENVSVELVKVKYGSQRPTVLGRDLHHRNQNGLQGLVSSHVRIWL